ncbi:MAG: imidazole glycerol phosphate synthase subunit HisH [Candidatus Lokiarchaeota archaeon]|nr:imidazole glycerol phosphate synthase subunit HisH [Candidatus Lokiarchaeota archaeon]
MTFYIAIIDYEMGNLKSIYKLLEYLNIKAVISSDPKEILNANGVILPGVGAFGDAMMQLKKKNLIQVIESLSEDRKPIFGICLGHQLLFSLSEEMGTYQGLDLIKGKVISFNLKNVEKVPQIGWNSVKFELKDHYLIEGIPNNSYFYFVHSYYVCPKDEENILGTTEYGTTKFSSIVFKDNIVGTQFHPEKSSKYGIEMYRNFINYCKK